MDFKIKLLSEGHQSWVCAKDLRDRYFFDPQNMKDPYTWTFDHESHKHFVLEVRGVDIGYAHVQLWPKERAALRIIVIDDMYRNQGYAKKMMHFLEKWLKDTKYKSLHIESLPSILKFYEDLGYTSMPFDDPDGYKSDPSDVPIGKIL